jgi:hypothetical protein
LSEAGGGHLLKSHRDSPTHLLSTVYPEHEWLPWKFVRCPLNYWSDVNNQRKFMDWAATQLNVKEMSDWYKISQRVSISTLSY